MLLNTPYSKRYRFVGLVIILIGVAVSAIRLVNNRRTETGELPDDSPVLAFTEMAATGALAREHYATLDPKAKALVSVSAVHNAESRSRPELGRLIDRYDAALENGDEAERQAIAEELRNNEAGMLDLYERIVGGGDRRSGGLYLLEGVGTARARELMLNLLKSPDPELVAYVVSFLQVSDNYGLAQLVVSNALQPNSDSAAQAFEVLRGAARPVWADALMALANRGEESGRELVLHWLAEQSEPNIYPYLVTKYYGIADAELAEALLRRATTDPSELTLQQAFEAIPESMDSNGSKRFIGMIAALRGMPGNNRTQTLSLYRQYTKPGIPRNQRVLGLILMAGKNLSADWLEQIREEESVETDPVLKYMLSTISRQTPSE